MSAYHLERMISSSNRTFMELKLGEYAEEVAGNIEF